MSEAERFKTLSEAEITQEQSNLVQGNREGDYAVFDYRHCRPKQDIPWNR